jgi:type I restriction enzyme S subunit
MDNPMKKLAEIAQLIDSLHKTPAYVDRGFPMVRVTDIKRGFMDLTGTMQVDEPTYEEFTKRYKPQDGDILFSRVGSYGNSCYVNRTAQFCLGQNTVCISPNKERIDPYYLYCCLNSNLIRDQIEGVVGGASQPTVSLANINKLSIPCPDLTIQKRISSIISAYDDLIENNTHRIKILEEMARMIYREWFVNFCFPGHERFKMVESEFGAIPAGWAYAPLEKGCQRITDGSHRSPKSVDTGLPMASVKDMHNWGLDLQQCRKITSEDFENLVRNDCKPLVGDVLIAKDGSYLKHCFWVQKPMEVVILSSIAILRPNKDLLSSYLSLHLLDPQIKGRMAGYVSGVALPRIILKDFRNFRILMPPLDIQLDFAHLTEPLLQLCWNLKEQNATLRYTRDLLLPRLISGDICVEQLQAETANQIS